MKSLVVMIAMFSFANFANAQNSASARLSSIQLKGTPVVDHQLSLVGRGIHLKKSGESLAIACIEKAGDFCKTLSWVYFDANQNAYLFGKKMAVETSNQPSGDEVKQSIRAQLKQFKSFERSDRLWHQTHSSEGLLFVGASGALILMTPALVAIPVIIVGGAIYHIRGGEFGMFLAGVDSETLQVVRDQNGWNWSSKPKRVSEKKMTKLLNYILFAEKLSVSDQTPHAAIRQSN